MNPTKFKGSNILLKGPDGSGIKDLHARTNGQVCTSCWKLDLRERLMVLVTGKVWASVWSGRSQPPIKLAADQPDFPDVEVSPEDVRAITRAAIKRMLKEGKSRASLIGALAVMCLSACAPLTHPVQSDPMIGQDPATLGQQPPRSGEYFLIRPGVTNSAGVPGDIEIWGSDGQPGKTFRRTLSNSFIELP